MKISDEALEFAAREAFAILRHTNAPRTQKDYAQPAIMKYNREHALVVVQSYIKKASETGFVQELVNMMPPEEKRRLLKQLLEEKCN